MKKRIKNYVRVNYEKIKVWGLKWPVYHTFLEINHNGKISKHGFKTKNKLKRFWPFSLLTPLKGMIKNETFVPDVVGKTLTKDKRKIQKLLKEIEKTKWNFYHLIFHNCFEWRNAVLKKSGIIPPKDHYTGPEK